MINDLQLKRTFLILCSILSIIIGLNDSIFHIIVLVIVLIGLFSLHMCKEKITSLGLVYSEKKLLIPAVIVYTIFFINGVLYGLHIYSKVGIESENIKLYIKIILLLFFTFGLKIFNSSIKKFNWSITKKQLLYTLGFAVFISSILIGYRGLGFLNLKSDQLLYNVLYIIFLDGIFEESSK